MDRSHIDHLAQIIWSYHHVHHTLIKADCIMVLGSHDTRVADRGAALYLEGWAPYILFSGGLGNLTLGKWDKPEADIFARIAQEQGVPESAILIENQSTNTGENIRFSYEVLQAQRLDPKTMILVQKPYMERRTYATFAKQWPGQQVDFRVTSPQISFEAYPTSEITREQVIHIMVGDLQRIEHYPKKGFQIPQKIPKPVMQAYQELIELGFTDHLIST